jgi:CubicO group peptidase (beta-lactamase class C family)
MQVSVIVAVAALTASCLAAKPPAPSLDAAIDALAIDALKQPVAGLSIAIARRRQLIFARGYGRANLGATFRSPSTLPSILTRCRSTSRPPPL